MDDAEKQVGLWIDHAYVKLALMIVVILMLAFLATKAGFSLWILNKVNLSSEHLTPCPPGQSPNIMGVCR